MRRIEQEVATMPDMLKALPGGYTVALYTYSEDVDATPVFKGLPDDRCPCPHWGYVITGKLGFRYADGREETFEAGDAYYAEVGHIPVIYAGTEVVEFSPSDQLESALQVIERNLEALQTA